MKANPSELFKKVVELNQQVRENLRRRGLAIPKKDTQGNVILGRYKIVKDNQGFFDIIDYGNEKIVSRINLPQTAIIIANKLALGKFIDNQILSMDRSYGHAKFEEMLQKKIAGQSLKSRNLDRAELMFTKAKISKYKKDSSKSRILLDFEKLMRMR